MKAKFRINYMLAVVLSLAILLPSTVRAAGIQPYASDQILSYTASISGITNGTLKIYYHIRGSSVMNVLGASSIIIQRKDGTSWSSEYTYNIRDYPMMQTSNSGTYQWSITYTPKYDGKRYRAQVFFYARDSFGSDTAIKTTNEVVS